MNRRQRRARLTRRQHHVIFGAGVMAAATVLTGHVGLADAASKPTVTVNSLDDTSAPTATLQSHETLGDAIQYLDGKPTGGTIRFASHLSGDIELTVPLPQITTPMIIDGPGAAQITLDGAGVGDDGILNIEGDAAGSEVDGLTFVNGSSKYGGGAITTFVALTVDGDVFHSNTAISGGGGAILADGHLLTVKNSTFIENNATAVPAAFVRPNGGAVESLYGGLSVSGSTFDGNSAENYGGAISVMEGSPVTVTSSSITGNTADAAGGIMINSSPGAVINGSLIAHNTANSASGIEVYTATPGDAYIENSTVYDNRLDSSANANPTASLGAITVRDLAPERLHLIGDTVFDNRGADVYANSYVSTDAQDSIISGGGNGYDFFSYGTVTLESSFVDDVSQPADYPDVSSIGTDASDITGTSSSPADPELGGLEDNGGPVQTIMPRPGSPVIDSGSTVSASNLPFPFNVDGRGYSRPVTTTDGPVVSDGTDMGAVEVQSADYPLAATSISSSSGHPGDLVTIHGTGLEGASGVDFGDSTVPASVFTRASSTAITFPVPNVEGLEIVSGISVDTPHGVANLATSFSIVPPTVTASTPSTDDNTGLITISGSGLSTATAVTVGPYEIDQGQFVSQSGTRLVVPVPNGSGRNLAVTVSAGGDTVQSPETFSFIPMISQMSEHTGSPGDRLTLAGRDLSHATSVTVGSTKIMGFFSDSQNSITFSVPLGYGKQAVSVNTPDGTATAVPFVYKPVYAHLQAKLTSAKNVMSLAVPALMPSKSVSGTVHGTFADTNSGAGKTRVTVKQVVFEVQGHSSPSVNLNAAKLATKKAWSAPFALSVAKLKAGRYTVEALVTLTSKVNGKTKLMHATVKLPVTVA